MAPKLATGYERLALQLEQHIRWYQPKSRVEAIHNAATCPYIESGQARTFLAAHKSGSLQSRLEEMGETKDYPDCQLKPWYVREAIADFFDRELYISYKGDLD